MHNRIFIYNIIYVLIHILCYVVFITKMLEIKQNELNTHMCIIYLGRADIYSPIFYPRQVNFLIKNISHFWTMCNSRNPYNPGYFTYPKNPPWLPEGECVPLRRPTQFSTSRPLPSITQIPTQNTSKSFENHFDAPSKSPLFPTTFSSLKIPNPIESP